MKNMSTKLLAGLAVIAAGNVAAMELMSGEDLAEAVGQDGVSLMLVLPDFDGAGAGTDLGIRMNSLIFHDSTGVPGATTPGAIQLGTGVVGDRLEITQPANSLIRLDFDMVGDAISGGGASDAMLNLRITTPAMVIKTGKFYAAASSGTTAPTTDLVKFMESMTITLGGGVANLQLGNEAQGSMLSTSSNAASGLNIANFVLYDVNSGGAVNISNINISNSGAADFDLKTSWDIGATGLFITVNQFGSALTGANVKMTGLKFGSSLTPAIGNAEFVGLDMAGTALRVTGKL